MASLVWREKADTNARVSAELEGPISALREAAKRVGKVGNMCLYSLSRSVSSDLTIVRPLSEVTTASNQIPGRGGDQNYFILSVSFWAALIMPS